MNTATGVAGVAIRTAVFAGIAIASLLWTNYFIGMEYYGIHLSWWALPLVLGSFLCLAAGISIVVRRGRTSVWLELAGSSLLSIFWLPAGMALFAPGNALTLGLAVRAFTVLMAIAALCVAVFDFRRGGRG